MNDATVYLWLFILVMTAATFLTRALPFVLLYKYAQNDLLVYLGRYLPPMLMVVLLVYSFQDENFISVDFLPELLGVVVTAVMHLLWRQPLVSITTGTGVYMVSIQLDWVSALANIA